MNEEQPIGTESDAAASVVPPLRRRPRRRKAVYAPAQGKLWAIFALLVVFTGCGLFYYHQIMQAHYAITLNGKTLFMLETRADAEKVLLQLKQRIAPEAPEAVLFKEGNLGITRLKSAGRIYSVSVAVDKLGTRLTGVVGGAAIYVNRRPLVLVASKAAAAQAISIMEEQATGEKQGTPTIKEAMAIRDYQQTAGDAHVLPVMSPAHAAAELAHPPRPQYHTVTRGESFYVIAQAHGITVEEVKALNPKLNPAALRPGDQVRLPDIPAPVTIIIRSADESQ